MGLSPARLASPSQSFVPGNHCSLKVRAAYRYRVGCDWMKSGVRMSASVRRIHDNSRGRLGQMTKRIMLVHGAWVTTDCWTGFRAFFGDRGYSVVVPPWPYLDKSVEELRRNPDPRL